METFNYKKLAAVHRLHFFENNQLFTDRAKLPDIPCLAFYDHNLIMG